MNQQTLETAIYEAERFLKKAHAANKQMNKYGFCESPKEAGAVKRASMDLTRALADMRRPT